MKKILFEKILLTLSLLALFNFCYAEIPKKFYGIWDVNVDKDEGFPWWDQIKHPVSVEFSDRGVVFIDQSGSKCAPKVYFFDEELDAVIFKHCSCYKSEFAFEPFYRVKNIEDHLEAEVWTFKMLFKLSGLKNRSGSLRSD